MGVRRFREQNLVRKFASSGGGKEKFTQAVSYAGRLPQKLLRCPRRLPLGLILVVHPRSADRSLRHAAALLRLLFPAFFFPTHAAFASALPTDLAFATARRWVPFRPSSPSDSTSARYQLSRQPADQHGRERKLTKGRGRRRRRRR